MVWYLIVKNGPEHSLAKMSVVTVKVFVVDKYDLGAILAQHVVFDKLAHAYRQCIGREAERTDPRDVDPG
jgi:hypothetical protein